MDNYDHKEIEKKWQKKWAENPELYSARDIPDKPKKYILDMFPYPSGDGLHIGHVESYTATDIISRYFRMRGFNVLHPQGWDAFGLPAENYAIKTGKHPDVTTHNNIKNFMRQIKSLGMSYDWSREIDTSSPEYYKWTQWFFLLLYKNGLAYKKKGKVNWCESCQTVLANEQAEGGICERCKNTVTQKDLEQWFFKITDFIEPHPSPLPAKGGQACKEMGQITSGLLEGLDKLDWPESIKAAQRNWIGKSEGAIIKFAIKSEFNSESELNSDFIEVFTTRVDTIFGCTYCVVAPEHEIILKLKDKISNFDDVEKYIQDAKNKTDLERMETKEKTGVEIKGIKAVNPFNNEEVPIFVADYVLGHYGTGAVMAVPAHDERDFEFAKKYNLPIKKVIEPCFSQLTEPGKIKNSEPFVERDAIAALVKHWEKDEYISLIWKKVAWNTLITGGVEKGQTPEEAARAEIFEETGYKNLKLIKELPMVHSKFYHVPKKVNRFAHFHVFYFELENGEQRSITEEEQGNHQVVWVPKEKMRNYFTAESHNYIWQTLDKSETVYINDGVLNDSREYNFLTSEQARQKMTTWLEENNLGERRVNYKLRDWLVSRQRYWGAPIPIIYCDKCGMIPVPEKDLPVVLPTDVDFKPTGESPLKYSKTFHNAKCPNCGGNARRELDTMDTFVCSSWYYLRYADPKNEKEFAEKSKIEKWLPVDLYVGGAEHAVLHLLYARFFIKVLYNLKYINFDEPFLKLRNQGMILAEDGRKMSKSLGNVVNPDQVVEEFGADSLRIFEMFMGPLEDAKPWNTKGIVGIKRFLEKVYKLTNKVQIESELKANNKIKNLLHKTIKKVTEDVESMRFNTAISAMMILVNEMEKQEKINLLHYSCFLLLLSPFAPHIAEELWNKLGNKESIFLQSWPEYDPELIQDEEINLVVQINGKIRDTIKVTVDISEEDAKKVVLESEKIKKHLAEKSIKKIIFIKNKLINIVV